MKKIFIISIALLFTCYSSFSQHFNKEELFYLKAKEDSLKPLSEKIVMAINPADRLRADSFFTKILVRALKTRNAFHYPFDSLFAISKLYSPDSVFRIFTWQLMIDENKVRQHGAIQMKTADGTLKLIPLIDNSENTFKLQDTIVNNSAWIGAIYYKILMNKYQDKKIYTLLGYDEGNIRISRKILELMHFENDAPIFGGFYFDYSSDTSHVQYEARHVMEFKKEAGPRLTYDEEMKMIIMEHLVSESNEPTKKWTLVGDGDYEGYKWEDGKWHYISKVFNQMIPEGKAPVPENFLDKKENNKIISPQRQND